MVCLLSLRTSFFSWDLTFILIYSIKSDVISDLPLAVIGFYITRSIFKTNLANFNSILLSRALYFFIFFAHSRWSWRWIATNELWINSFIGLYPIKALPSKSLAVRFKSFYQWITEHERKERKLSNFKVFNTWNYFINSL